MRFKPLSDEEAQQSEFEPLPEGTYQFQVLEAEDTTSKKGNEMIKMKVRIMSPDGPKRNVFDYLLEAMEFKLRHFCEATGLMGNYNAGTLNASHCVEKTGECRVTVEESPGYGKQNKIEDYLKPDDSEDGIPF